MQRKITGDGTDDKDFAPTPADGNTAGTNVKMDIPIGMAFVQFDQTSTTEGTDTIARLLTSAAFELTITGFATHLTLTASTLVACMTALIYPSF